MPINYGAITGGPTADTVTDPQKLFQALPAKAAKYAYLRDVQGDVLRKWYETRASASGLAPKSVTRTASSESVAVM